MRIDPTWTGMLGVHVALIADGSSEGRRLAIEELGRMARAADLWNGRDDRLEMVNTYLAHYGQPTLGAVIERNMREIGDLIAGVSSYEEYRWSDIDRTLGVDSNRWLGLHEVEAISVLDRRYEIEARTGRDIERPEVEHWLADEIAAVLVPWYESGAPEGTDPCQWCGRPDEEAIHTIGADTRSHYYVGCDQ